jgi:beta-lactam-binding protein with PASTA domain
MPDLVGLLLDRAQQDRRVTDLNLRLIPREQVTNDRRPGTIVDQEPELGIPIKPGTPATVFVAVPVQSPPPPVLRMPDLVGQQFQSAQDDSRVLRLKLQLVAQSQPTPNERPGVILRHEPPADSPVRAGMPVTVFVAVPVQPQLFPMPDLVGRAFPMAERDASVVQLQLRLSQQIDSRAGGPPNTIVRQSVPAGANVQIGDAVTVFVASGVAVPSVVRQQADTASERIVAVGLNPRRTDETSDEPSGTVLRQVPEAGVLVARGAAVGITVAVPRKVVIPNVVGRTKADATQMLARLQLRASPADDEASALPPDQVVSQVPVGGTEAVVGAAVRIAVATGVEVPNLSGLSTDEAQRAVAARGLSFEDSDQETDAAPAGQVFQQQPASGTRVTRGTRVLATVAIPVPVLVPSVLGLPRQKAVAVLEAAGLRAAPAPDPTASGRLVERQAPVANTRVARLTTITLFVAAPPPPPVTPQPNPGLPVPAPLNPAPANPAPLDPVPLDPVLLDPVPLDPVQPPPAAQPGVTQTQVTIPAGIQQPAQNNGGAAATIPIQPLLPPWLLSLLVAIAAIGASTFRLWWPGRPPPAPPIQTTAPATPAPAVDVRPDRGDSTLRLEVSGRSLISMDVRVRVGHGSVEHTLSLEEQPFILDERRLYE